MVSLTQQFPLGLSFNDVLLLPGHADFSRAAVDISTSFTKKISLSLPFVSSPMDTVTESKLAIALARLGGIGIIHRNLSITGQVEEVEKVKRKRLLVGAAVGASKGFEKRVQALARAKVDVIVVDSAHGYAQTVIDAVKLVKRFYRNVQVVAGNVATFEGAKALIESGVDGLRVGMGPGTICTTRIISGMGVPQMTAILEAARAAKKAGVPVIADGGIRYSGDIVKALAAGASTVMMGSFLASSLEAPGRVVALTQKRVPRRFKSVFGQARKALPSSGRKSASSQALTMPKSQGVIDKDEEVYHFKEYRGMGSMGAMEKGKKMKEVDEFHGKDYYKERVLVAEGVEGLVPVKGTVEEIVGQAVGGIESGMYYVGAKTVKELWKKARFIQITQASLAESHPHGVLVTNPGKNY